MSENSPDDSLAELAQLSRTAPAKAAPLSKPHDAAIGLRRTLIPPLLTAGIGLPALAAAWWTTPLDSPYRRIGVDVPVILIALGAVLLLLAIANMLFVRSALRQSASLPVV